MASVVDESEVVIVGFPICAERLLIDLRADGAGGPLIELVEPLTSPTERALWLAERRPALGAPDRSVFFMWPHTVGYLRDSEVVATILDRARREHGLELEGEVRDVLSELRGKERRFTLDAVAGGAGFETLWSRDR